MEIRKQLLLEHSKANTELIANYIGGQQERFDILMELFLNNESRVAQRAAWVVGEVSKKYPDLVNKHLEKMMSNLRKKNLHDAIKRNTVRVLQEITIPEALWGETADVCFGLLVSKNEPVAVKCFSMTVLLNIVKHVPELKEELKIIVEDQMPYASAGFQSRGKKTLNALEKIKASSIE
uniref:hypothetical protein n=1 Tax=Roseivirga sp. TaxID=1964215 RepID=UPI00404860A7